MVPGAKFSTSTSACPRESRSAALPALGLEVEHDRLLAAVEHGEGQRRAADHAAPAQRLAARRLDLDHRRAGHRQQERGIGAVVDLGEIEDDDAVEGLVHGRGLVRRTCCCSTPTAASRPRRMADQSCTGHMSWSSPWPAWPLMVQRIRPLLSMKLWRLMMMLEAARRSRASVGRSSSRASIRDARHPAVERARARPCACRRRDRRSRRRGS